MTYSLFNGSYISHENTGIGVVSKELINLLPSESFGILDPFSSGELGSIEIPSNMSPSYGYMGHLRRLIWLQRNVPILMKKRSAEFFISPLPEAPLFRSIRSIVLIHDLIPLRYPRLSILTAYNMTYVPQVLHQSEAILCNSNATAKEINEYFGIPIQKLYPIKLGFNQFQFYPLDLNRDKYFVVLGRHNPHKNLKRVLRAFSLIKAKEYKLILIGPFDKRYTPALKNLAVHLGIADRCVWMGWISSEQKLTLLNRCRALLLVSLWEGFGLPALEAMACGTPVIASNKGALLEVLGDLGNFVDPLSLSSIVSMMEDVINDNQYLLTARDKGPTRASSYNWEDAVNSIEEIIMNKS